MRRKQLHNNAHKTKRLLRRRQVQDITGLSRSSLYDLISKGLFPRPISLVPGGRSVAWDADAIEIWVQSRIEASRKAS